MVGKTKRGFGQVTKMRSGRYQARFTVPATHPSPYAGQVHTLLGTYGGDTFGREQAQDDLRDERRLLEREGADYHPPKIRQQRARQAARDAETNRVPTFEEYATKWVASRKVKGRPLAPRTRDGYLAMLETHVNKTFGAVPLDEITLQAANDWYDGLRVADRRKARGDTGETMRVRVYSLVRSIMNSATDIDGPLPGGANPFRVRGAGSNPKHRREEIATAEEYATILKTIRPEWRAIIELGLWCGLRYSEVVALRRRDVSLTKKTVRVPRAVSRSKSGVTTKDPKSGGVYKAQPIPANALPVIRKHLKDHVNQSLDALLFPDPNDGFLGPSTFYGKADATPGSLGAGWYAARKAAGHVELHYHDLRATGATLLAQNGATVAELQEWLRDSTEAAALRYIRVARSRMGELTSRLAEVAAAGEW